MPEQYTNPVDVVLSVIVPCYNEEGNVSILNERILGVFNNLGIIGETIFINDGSVDDTEKLLQVEAQKFPNIVRIIRHETNKGLEAGWCSGVRLARGKYVCIIDGDLQYRPEDIGLLFQTKLSSSASIIQGARQPIKEIRRHRYVLSKGLNSLLNVTFGMKLKDNKSGFLLMKREIFEDILKHRLRYKFFQSLICVSAARKGYTIECVDVLFDKRHSGRSFMSDFPVRVILGCLQDVFKGYFEFVVLKKFRDLRGAN